ncbi:hypothetical protein JMF89_14670 [Clostridiaceae bacterium UIB06]|nr:hypothetical protein [Clostridiaceae bacterium UIB06]
MSSIQLNLRIYPLKYIEKAIEDYHNVVGIRYHIEENKAILNFDCEEEVFSLIKNELCNYIIGLIGKYI